MGFEIEKNVLVKYIDEGETEIVIPYGVKRIKGGSFSKGNIKKITFPDTVLKVSTGAFNIYGNVKYITVKSENESITAYDPEGIISHKRTLKKDAKRLLEFISADDKRRENIFFEMNRVAYKIPCAVAIADKSEAAKEYIKKNIKKIITLCIETENMELLEKVLATGLIRKRTLDSLIKYAIDNKKTEVQVVLMHYKNANMEFENDLKKLML